MAHPKVKRKLSVGIYLTALIITVLIFSLGVYVGSVIDENAKVKVEGELVDLEENLYLSRIMLLMEDKTGNFCPIYLEKLDTVNSERELIGDRLEYLENVRGLTDNTVKEKYYYLEFENYLLMKKMEEKCGSKNKIILFFYDDGEESKKQGETLDTFRKNNEEVKVFSFDGNSDSAVVRVLKKQYNIGQYPAIVFEGDNLKGMQSLGQLETKLIK